LDLALNGTVVLVTGGGRGVGLGITRAFLDAGATVVICGRRQPETETGAEFMTCDVREAEQVDSLVTQVTDRFGRLDVLVNNAGGAPPADAATASPRFHESVVRLNLLAPLLMSQRVNAVMQKQDTGGAIVMISSVAASRPAPDVAAYGAAKAGLNSLTSSLAVEWAPKVRVNALAAGMVRTELTTDLYGDWSASIPLGRLAEPAEVGACAVFLASPLASYVSGATLLVHGGGEVKQ
jgi:NAD(P)-dependent dehydrogenase (short-subunit alcohol dehydrogenase family)